MLQLEVDAVAVPRLRLRVHAPMKAAAHLDPSDSIQATKALRTRGHDLSGVEEARHVLRMPVVLVPEGATA